MHINSKDRCNGMRTSWRGFKVLAQVAHEADGGTRRPDLVGLQVAFVRLKILFFEPSMDLCVGEQAIALRPGQNFHSEMVLE